MNDLSVGFFNQIQPCLRCMAPLHTGNTTATTADTQHHVPWCQCGTISCAADVGARQTLAPVSNVPVPMTMFAFAHLKGGGDEEGGEGGVGHGRDGTRREGLRSVGFGSVSWVRAGHLSEEGEV